MPLKRENDEERVERVNQRVERLDKGNPKSAGRRRDNRLTADGGGNGDNKPPSRLGRLAWLPLGYRVVTGKPADMVECDRGCGWRLTLQTLVELPDAARDQLFRFHEDGHLNR